MSVLLGMLCYLYELFSVIVTEVHSMVHIESNDVIPFLHDVIHGLTIVHIAAY